MIEKYVKKCFLKNCLTLSFAGESVGGNVVCGIAVGGGMPDPSSST